MASLIRDLARARCGSPIKVRGWIRSVRRHKDHSFIVVNDGTNCDGIQVVYRGDGRAALTTGAAVDIDGVLVACPSARHRSDREVVADAVRILGACDPGDYPLQKKHHSNEFLRKVQHLRGRTADFSATMRIRNTAACAIHDFFGVRHFQWIHAPILTGSDCEGAGNVFQVRRASSPSDSVEFFGVPAFLTVSAQLHAEMFACTMGPVYTFGPTFRSENSNTSRHLAEFWMVEPEVPFATLATLTDLAEQLVKHAVASVISSNTADLIQLGRDPETALLNSDFARITYSEAIKILQTASASVTFQHAPVWGRDLQTEHELYLASVHFQRPVFVTDYPKALKPFYMKESVDDERTVACLDLLMPGIGEVVGGSERIDDADALSQSMQAHGIDQSRMDWYLDLRRFGSIPHGGFGLGFDRLVQFIGGIGNIRDVVPVPRVPGSCPY